MPENDFEKQVQRLFDELQLKPSAEVWPKVSGRIRKEKSRKRIFIWIPLALLLLGTGGYWLLQNNGSYPAPDSLTKSTAASENSKQNTAITASPAAGSTMSNAGSNTHGSGSDSHASNGPQHSVKPPVNIQALGNTKQQAPPAVHLPVPDHAGKLTAVADEKSKPIAQASGNNKKGMASAGSKEVLNSTNKNAIAIPLLAVQQFVHAKVLHLPGIETAKILYGIPKENIAGNTNTPVKLTKKKVWEWGISGGAGVSSVSDGLSELFGNSSTEKSLLNAMPSTPNMSNNINFLTGQNSLVAAMPPPASTVKKGLAWQAGGFVKWKMTSRLAITGGLQYSYYSTNRAVGNDINNYRLALGNTQNDANASYAGYYIGGQNINYTNRYHFIEIPVGMQWQFNKAAKFPLLLNGGLSLSYLANTTAVHYHAQTGSYYEDKTLFNKIQAGVYAGASVKFFANSKRPLYAGPVVQYNITNLLKSSVNLNQHFIYAGLKAEWVLGKK
ncbi:outer membrane beta-barrel protein [Agriterribacter sp.]|uniref:outer membrane beta-barrel protein n=1 Tax=Agriterribacter sp. TaxID=2821509 RepID=UPI002C4CB531|nr:outer membrane beta-barrel protein [Agriterribacter sp.]HTN09304.1 outer membrane beta-barrel protein [Agriterribacter sp.]